MYITIVAPCFNDLKSANAIAQNFLLANLAETELLLVDNGSSPSESLSLLEVNSPRVRTLFLPKNVGFGGGISAGLNNIKGEWAVWIPGNFKVHPTDLKEFISHMHPESKEALIKAHRVGRKTGPKLKTFVASIVQTIASGHVLHDTGGTPTACHKDNNLTKKLAKAPQDYTFDTYVLVAAKQLRVPVKRINVPYHSRTWGESHWQKGFFSEVKLMISLVKNLRLWRKGLA